MGRDSIFSESECYDFPLDVIQIALQGLLRKLGIFFSLFSRPDVSQ